MAVLRKPYFLCIVILLNSCRQRVGNESFQVTKDGNGNLQSAIHYINDTVIHGLAKYYYYPNPKNILKDEIEFNHGVKNGWHKHYSKDGNLRSKIHWKDGLQDGDTFWYYENGTNVKSESFWVKGKAYGVAKWFYENGNLASINVTDFWGAVMYVI